MNYFRRYLIDIIMILIVGAMSSLFFSYYKKLNHRVFDSKETETIVLRVNEYSSGIPKRVKYETDLQTPQGIVIWHSSFTPFNFKQGDKVRVVYHEERNYRGKYFIVIESLEKEEI